MIFSADITLNSAAAAACGGWAVRGLAERYEGYGLSLKQRCKQMYGSFIGFAGRGEMIPNERSYCDLDPDVVDQWGIPVLRFHWQWGDNEIKMAKDMQETFKEMVESGGGTYFGVSPVTPILTGLPMGE